MRELVSIQRLSRTALLRQRRRQAVAALFFYAAAAGVLAACAFAIAAKLHEAGVRP